MRNYGRIHDASHMSHEPKLVTKKQAEFLGNLLRQVYTGDQLDHYTGILVRQVTENRLTRARASQMIDNLIKLRDAKGAAPAKAPAKTVTPETVVREQACPHCNGDPSGRAPGSLVHVEGNLFECEICGGESVYSDGAMTIVVDLSRHELLGRYYAVHDEQADKVRFFRIRAGGEDTKWAGWFFVDEQASDDFHKAGSQRSGKLYEGRYVELLAAILSNQEHAMALYGQEIGSCGVCGRTLTDELSRERGIGPTCWEKLAG